MDTEADAAETAAKRIAQLLQRPEQLDKVSEHRRRLLREKESVDARLRTALQTQVDDIRSGLELLHASIQNIRQVRGNLASVDTLCKSSRALGLDASEFKQVNDARKTLIKTRKNLDRIYVVPQTVKQLKIAMDAEDCNLLYIYENLSALEFIRDELLYHARHLSDEHEALQWYFAEVDTLSDLLAKRLWHLLDQGMSLIKTKPQLLVTVLRIVEREEKADIQVLDPAAPVKIDRSRRPRGYREKALERLLASAVVRFEAQVVDDKEHVEPFLERLSKFIFEDLLTVKNDFVPCFPPHYNIFNLYVASYNSHVSEVLLELVERELEPSEILAMLNWMQSYTENLQKKLGVTAQDPMPAEKQDLLMERYTRLVREKMQEWCRNIIKNELQEWIHNPDREGPPDTDSKGLYVTEATIILFQMIDQQVAVAFRTRHGKFIFEVVQLCTAMLLGFQDDFEKELNETTNGYFAVTPEERPSFMLEFLLAVVNNSVQCGIYAEQLRSRVEEDAHLEAQFLSVCRNQLANVVSGFEQLAVVAQGHLVRIILGDLDPVLVGLFTRKWYEAPREIDTVVATLDDYANDLAQHMHPDYVPKTLALTLDQVIISYVRAMFNKRALIKSDIRDLMKKDIDKLQQFFASKVASVPELKLQVDVRLSLLYDLRELATDTESIIPSTYYKIHTRHPDFSPEHMEIMLACRDDFGRFRGGAGVSKAIREMLEKHANKAKKTGAAASPGPSSNQLVVFSHISTKQ
ncbi:hypothetical protein CAOG_004879 [Capsaspora owczarzaki ATCC 30864]|uniref:Uncharacterized protein n=2 Tax=Capsaspora owczarzaki (strain ATCC 30864) TaxID=595528 RepID=A0A0D2X3F1_CAPO3|nr:hypothetical protein CAOG_004879 [Capsaspora owczarzaki ATCC 30864]